MNKKYIFIKPYQIDQGVIPQGSEITEFRGFMYFNGGLCHPAYEKILRHIINDDKLRQEYLKIQVIEKNEF